MKQLVHNKGAPSTTWGIVIQYDCNKGGCSFVAGTGAVVATLRILFQLPPSLPSLDDIGTGHFNMPWLQLLQGAFICAVSVMGGASLGPEAGLAMAGASVGSLLGKKLPLNKIDTTTVTLSSISGGLGGLFSSPLLSAVFLLELSGASRKNQIANLMCLLLPATLSFAIFFPIIGAPFFETFDTPSYEFKGWQLVAALLLGLLSMVVALVTGVVFALTKLGFGALSSSLGTNTEAALGSAPAEGAGESSSRARGTSPQPMQKKMVLSYVGQVILTAAAGAVVGLFAVLLPLTSSSGSTSLNQLVEHHEELSTGELLGSLFAKMLVTGISIHSGFVGGLVFPLLFLGGITGVLIHRMLPMLPLGLCFACGMGAVPGAMIPLPFSLVAVVGFSVNVDAVQSSCVALAVLAANVAFSGLAVGLVALKARVGLRRGARADEVKVPGSQTSADC